MVICPWMQKGKLCASFLRQDMLCAFVGGFSHRFGQNHPFCIVVWAPDFRSFGRRRKSSSRIWGVDYPDFRSFGRRRKSFEPYTSTHLLN
jgi:hypothetical protein